MTRRVAGNVSLGAQGRRAQWISKGSHSLSRMRDRVGVRAIA